MLTSDADSQLLFGLLAIQLRILSVESVSQALVTWSASRLTPLKTILIDMGLLDQAGGTLIESAAEHHLAAAEGDPRRGLETFAGSDALEALLGVLDHTIRFPTPREETIARYEAGPFKGVIPASERPRGAEPATEADGPAFEGSERTITFDGSGSGPGFQILRPLARGGLGELFVARDANLNREVALKLILKAQTADPQGKARFLLEAEITGGLEHPGIVPVYALGESVDGRPFYSMRLVRGETLKERIRKFHGGGSINRQSLEFRQLLNHFGRVCDVMAYAHSRGVLHRDLKPSNVMLGKFGETLVVDWGLAKPIDRTTGATPPIDDEPTLRPMSGSSMQGTLFGATVGTPQYMSPEQAMGQLDRIGPASDIYSLGATLYCILTGYPPLQEIHDMGEVLRRVALGDITPPRALKPEIPSTLESICKRAMAMQPDARYASAVDLAADIESWLADEPVQGVRESAGPRLGRWERRHRTFLRVSGLAIFAVALVAIGSALAVNRARERAEDRRQQAVELGAIAEVRKQEADRQRDALRRLTTRLTLDRGLSLLENNDRRAGLLWLARSLKGSSGQADPFGPAIRTNMAAWSRSLHRLRDCLDHQGAVRVVAWSPTGRSAATGSDDGTARLWDPVSGAPLCLPLVHAGPINAVVYSHDGKTLATASEDQTARLWNATSGLPRGEPIKHHGPVTTLAFTPGDATLITGSDDGTVRFWNGATGQPQGQAFEQGAPVKTLMVAPDGKTLATVSDKGAVILWDLATLKRRVDIEEYPTNVHAIAFSPDSTKLACGCEDRLVRLVDAATGKVQAVSAKFPHSGPVLAVAFAPDGTRIATGSYDTSCRVWRLPDLVPLGTTMEHRGHVWAVTFNPAGTLIAAAADDNTAQVWDVVKFQRHGDPLPHQKPVRSLAFSGDGRSILTGCDDNAARIWQLGDGPAIGQVMNHSTEVRSLASRPDGKAFATIATDGVLRLWDAFTTRLIAQQGGHNLSRRVELAYQPAGTMLVSAGRDGKLLRWNGATLERIDPPIQMGDWVRRLAFSPDGGTLIAGDNTGQVGFWDARRAAALTPVVSVQHPVTGLAYNHDGTRAAICDSAGEARIWDVARFQPIGEPMRHGASIQTAVFSPDGTRLATASYDKTARIWDAQTQKAIGEPLAHQAYVWSVEFSPDGNRVLTGSFDGTAQIWDGHTGRPIGEPMKNTDMIYGATFSGDAAMVLTFGRSRSARLWDATTSRPLGEPLKHDDEIFDAAFLPGRPVIATASADGTARLWSIPSPMLGTPERLDEEMTVLTGMELGSDDIIRLLDVPTWKRRRAALNAPEAAK
jgi:WD40 repeat protein/serine/threonine protein kinase